MNEMGQVKLTNEMINKYEKEMKFSNQRYYSIH
jgi:hypothetical protein